MSQRETGFPDVTRALSGLRPPRLRGVRHACAVSGCANATTAGKPHCIDHLELQPYVKELMAKLARRERPETLDEAGTAEVIVEHLELHGAATLGRLAREVRVQVRRLAPCVAALERAGIVETQRLGSRHGHAVRVVALTRPAHESSRSAG
jgi:hypothetical protein